MERDRTGETDRTDGGYATDSVSSRELCPYSHPSRPTHANPRHGRLRSVRFLPIYICGGRRRRGDARQLGRAAPLVYLNMKSEKEKLEKLALDLKKDYPRSPRSTLAGYVLAGRALDKCRATLAGTNGEYHFNCPLDNMFFGFAGINGEEFKNFVATGADDDEVAKWIEEHAIKRPRLEIIKWNNDLRYKRVNELSDDIQEFMEDYIPENVPKKLIPHINYFFDIYDAEEKRL
jgi:Domain of unknown function (DUF5069)